MSESDDHDDHSQPNLKFLDRYVEKSCETYGVLCGCHCFMFLLFIILSVAVGKDFLYMDNDLPLYQRGAKFQKRQDAVVSAVDIANYDFNTPALQLQQSQAQPHFINAFGLEFIYETKSGGGNIWDISSLEEILAFEQYVENRPGYKDFCVRQYDAYARELERNTTSIANPNHVELNVQILRDYLARNADTFKCKPYQSALVPCSDPSPDCLNVNSNPPGVIDCKIPLNQCQTIDRNFVHTKLLKFAQLSDSSLLFNQSFPVQLFYSYTHFAFGGSTTAIPAIRSSFPFGLPLKGYDSTNDRFDDQVKDVEKFLWDTYGDYLWNKNFQNINYYWDGAGMFNSYVAKGLTQTFVFIALSFLGVWVYLSVMTKSCFKSTMGMGQILLSFFSAYILYRGIFQIKYFGIFNVLSIFIILGIGADDIFVFLDTFSQAGLSIDDDGDEKSKYKQQLSNGWRVASKAMLVTSLTTMISFLTNASSVFPAVYTFGVFSALLVFVNYMSVIFYYPSVVMVYETMFKDKECCGPLGGCVMRVIHYIFGEEPPSREKDKMGGIEKWFRDYYVPFVIKRKYIILLVTLIGLIRVLVAVTKLEADPNQPQMFADSNNYQAFGMKKGSYFARGGGIYNIKVNMAFGINRQNPIDRAGSVATNLTDVGTVIWDPTWKDLYAANDYIKQLAFVAKLAPCVISLCEKVDDPVKNMKTYNPDNLWLGGVEFRSDCMLRDFKDYVVKRYGTAYWATAIDGTATGVGYFANAFLLWFDGPVIEDYKKFNYFEKVTLVGGSDIKPVIRLFKNEIKLLKDQFVPYQDGIKVANNWDDWFNGELKSGVCKDVASVQNAFVYSGAFTYFFLQEQLTMEAFSGIAYSIIAAFCVLSVFTLNWVVGLLATITIACIILCVMGFTVLNGWKLGVLESICFVMVPGMAVDFVAHLAEVIFIHIAKKEPLESQTCLFIQAYLL